MLSGQVGKGGEEMTSSLWGRDLNGDVKEVAGHGSVSQGSDLGIKIIIWVLDGK